MKRMIAVTVMLVVTASVAAGQDLIVNGHFDTDISGWTLVAGQGSQAWDPLDWQGDPGSGSMVLTNTNVGGAQFTASGECFTLTPSGTYEFGGHFRFASGQPQGFAGIIVGWYSNTTCNGQPMATVNSPPVLSTTTNTWVESFSPSVTAPGGTLSVGVGPLAFKNGAGGSLAVNVDRVRFGPTGTTPVQGQSFTVE